MTPQNVRTAVAITSTLVLLLQVSAQHILDQLFIAYQATVRMAAVWVITVGLPVNVMWASDLQYTL